MTVNTAVFWEMASCSLVTRYHHFVETRCLHFGVYRSIRFLRNLGTFPLQLHSALAHMTVILIADTWQSIKNRNFITNSFHCFGMHNNAFAVIYCVWGTCIVLECSNLSKIYPRNWHALLIIRLFYLRHFYVEHPVVIRVHRWIITASHNLCVYCMVQCDTFRLNI